MVVEWTDEISGDVCRKPDDLDLLIKAFEDKKQGSWPAGGGSLQGEHPTWEQLQGAAEWVAQTSPKEAGIIEAIVVRPDHNVREFRLQAQLCTERGLHDDRWHAISANKHADGEVKPKFRREANQLSIMNSRALALLAGKEERMCLAGDNLLVDFDLTGLKEGDYLAIIPRGQEIPSFAPVESGADASSIQIPEGALLLQVTEKPHTGCASFRRRYGLPAREWVNTEPWGTDLRLRGVFATILRAGPVQLGDRLVRIPSHSAA